MQLMLFLGDINNEITSESVAKHECQLITDGNWGRVAEKKAVGRGQGCAGKCRRRSGTGAENGL